jgi:hypothetical protein
MNRALRGLRDLLLNFVRSRSLEGWIFGSSGKWMSDGQNSSFFLAQRRGGQAGKPHNIPMLIRLEMGMGDERCIHFSAPRREKTPPGIPDTKFSEELCFHAKARG